MKFVVLLADGFEEVEALTVVDYLRRVGIKVYMASLGPDLVEGAHGIRVQADLSIDQVEAGDFVGLTIPGGMPGSTNLRDDPRVIDLVGRMDRDKKLISAICAGPIVLERAGVIKGKRITSYPGFEDSLKSGLYVEDGVVVNGNIITARGPALAGDFALELVSYLLGEERLEELKKDILYNFC